MATFLRVATRLVWCVAALLGLRLVYLHVASRTGSEVERPSRQAMSIVPHTVVLRTERTGRLEKSTKAVRSDGSMSYLVEVYLANSRIVQRLIRNSSGERLVTDEILEWKTAIPDDGFDVRSLHRDPESQCMKNYQGLSMGNSETLLGLWRSVDTPRSM